MSVADRLASVRARVDAACARSGRASGEITLVAVSKTMPAALVDEAIAAGAEDIGENRVQEAREKFAELRHPVRKHLIGALQSNKAKVAVGLFDVIHTIDSLALAETVNRHAAHAARTIDVFIQINVGEEPQKRGVPPADAEALMRDVSQLSNLRLRGLMAIPPHETEESSVRHHFRVLRGLRDGAVGRSVVPELPHLSMGMTEDFEMAIEEGATVIRVGRAIFGERQS